MYTVPHFDLHQFTRSARPVSAKTGISWQDYGNMHVTGRVESYDRRLPCPAWALSDSLLRPLLVTWLENRLQIYDPVGTLEERRAAAEAKSVARIPEWNSTLDRLQLQYVAGQHNGTPKQRLKELAQQIENLDTLIRVSRNGGLGFVAGIVVLYYRMGKNSVEVGDALNLKPPHVRMTLFNLHRVWNDYFNLDFTLQPSTPAVPPCRTYTKPEISTLLAAGRITIPKDEPRLQPQDAPPLQPGFDRPPRIPGESSKDRRNRLKGLGICATCEIRAAAPYRECPTCRAKSTEWQKSFQRKKRAAAIANSSK